MNIKIEKIESLCPYESDLKNIVNGSLKKARKMLDIKDVIVVVKVTEHPGELDDIGGVGGYCPNKSLIEISLDINNKIFKKSYRELIERTLFHELHHIARRQKGVAIGESSFLECLFSEGLADLFVYKMTGKKPIWVVDLDKDTEDELITRAEKLFNEPITDNLYDDWFIKGLKKLNIPRWAGYALGYKLVDSYLENNSNISFKSLTAVPAINLIEKF